MLIVSNMILRFFLSFSLSAVFLLSQWYILFDSHLIILYQVKVKRRGDDRKYVAKVSFASVILTCRFLYLHVPFEIFCFLLLACACFHQYACSLNFRNYHFFISLISSTKSVPIPYTFADNFPLIYTAQVLVRGVDCDIALLSVESEDFWKGAEPLRLGHLPRLQVSSFH